MIHALIVMLATSKRADGADYFKGERYSVPEEIASGFIGAGLAQLVDVPPQSVDGQPVLALQLSGCAKRLVEAAPLPPPAQPESPAEVPTAPPASEE